MWRILAAAKPALRPPGTYVSRTLKQQHPSLARRVHPTQFGHPSLGLVLTAQQTFTISVRHYAKPRDSNDEDSRSDSINHQDNVFPSGLTDRSKLASRNANDLNANDQHINRQDINSLPNNKAQGTSDNNSRVSNEKSKPSHTSGSTTKGGATPNTLISKASAATSQVAQRVPKTLDSHLNGVKSIWGRLAVRTKWALIKNYRPFNTDEISAMFSWIMWGHILWILLGTTTFLSLIIWAMSKFRAEDMVARWVGRIVTKETGMRVVFEQAILPDWKMGAIVLRKVFVQRRPGAIQKVATGPQASAAAAPTATTSTTSEEVSAEDANSVVPTGSHVEVDEGNYTQFDLTIDTVSVTLSLKRWLSGRGILETVEAKGIRGVIDRRFLKFDPHYEPTKHRKKYKRGDFDWETTKIEDLVVTVLQPNHQPELPPVPPFQISLFSCEFPRFRKQWLLYDMLNANYVSGSFDKAMFSMHTRQLPTDVTMQGGFPRSTDSNSSPSIRKVQRLRIDDVDIRHLNRGATGMFGWIESGTCDFLADIMLPSEDLELTAFEQFKDLRERWAAQLKNIWSNKAPKDIVTQVERDVRKREYSKTVAIDLRVQFNNPRATAPLYSPDLNYINNAIIHPIVGYINSRDTYIPVHCHVAKRLYDFDGSWTVYDSGLMADLSSELYRAFARNAQDDQERSRRIKKVGFWSLQLMAQLALLTLGIVA